MDMRTKAQELVEASRRASTNWGAYGLEIRTNNGRWSVATCETSLLADVITTMRNNAPAIAQAYLESVQVFESIQRVLESEDWSDNEVLATVDLIVREFLNKVSKE